MKYSRARWSGDARSRLTMMLSSKPALELWIVAPGQTQKARDDLVGYGRVNSGPGRHATLGEPVDQLVGDPLDQIVLSAPAHSLKAAETREQWRRCSGSSIPSMRASPAHHRRRR